MESGNLGQSVEVEKAGVLVHPSGSRDPFNQISDISPQKILTLLYSRRVCSKMCTFCDTFSHHNEISGKYYLLYCQLYVQLIFEFISNMNGAKYDFIIQCPRDDVWHGEYLISILRAL